jgi:hypothetical protein
VDQDWYREALHKEFGALSLQLPCTLAFLLRPILVSGNIKCMHLSYSKEVFFHKMYKLFSRTLDRIELK